jgi:hypothetical protein
LTANQTLSQPQPIFARLELPRESW